MEFSCPVVAKWGAGGARETGYKVEVTRNSTGSHLAVFRDVRPSAGDPSRARDAVEVANSSVFGSVFPYARSLEEADWG
jgi:hypothetical protein